ncbi:SH3 domain-containing protein [Rummeliibacillus pycnus]|uniref:SH3 domain-containing protein n=1 Tax=Rummeliibacillus pycnus TaxID=101070 RepID=UPI0037C5281B
MKRIISTIIMLIFLSLISIPFNNQQVSAKTETLKVQSTVDDLNIREKPSKKSKIIGKLYKNQSLPLKVLYKDNTFNEIVFKGNTAYISADYSNVINPKTGWLGNYWNDYYSGSGQRTELNIYKKTTDYIYLSSHIGMRYEPSNEKLYGYQMPWEFKTYYGKAKLTSKNTAVLTKGSCKMTLKSVGKSVRIYKKSGSCQSTYLKEYNGKSVYKKW